MPKSEEIGRWGGVIRKEASGSRTTLGKTKKEMEKKKVKETAEKEKEEKPPVETSQKHSNQNSQKREKKTYL